MGYFKHKNSNNKAPFKFSAAFPLSTALFWMHFFKNGYGLNRRIKDSLVQKHFAQNSEAIQHLAADTLTPYIEKQRNLTYLNYGRDIKGPIGKLMRKLAFDGESLCAAHNTCEVIAVYNALLALNHEESPITFPKLLSLFEKDGICLSGNWGTEPKSIPKFFTKHFPEYKITFYKGKNIDKNLFPDNTHTNENTQESNDICFIVTFWNDPAHISCGIHTVCITKTDEKYHIHNNHKTGIIYDSLFDAMSNYKKGILCVTTVAR